MRTTLIQLGSLRETAMRELASRGPGLLRSRRSEVLAGLGEIIYELARSGELDLDDFPELAGAISELQAFDADFDAAPDTPLLPDDPTEGAPAVWRPNPDEYDEQGARVRPRTRAAASEPTRPTRRSGQGHIAFVPDGDDDDDLADYMNDDDVPDAD